VHDPQIHPLHTDRPHLVLVATDDGPARTPLVPRRRADLVTGWQLFLILAVLANAFVYWQLAVIFLLIPAWAGPAVIAALAPERRHRIRRTS